MDTNALNALTAALSQRQPTQMMEVLDLILKALGPLLAAMATMSRG